MAGTDYVFELVVDWTGGRGAGKVEGWMATQREKHGGRKVFFHRLWCRIQDLPIEEKGDLLKDSKKKKPKATKAAKKKADSDDDASESGGSGDETEDDSSDDEKASPSSKARAKWFWHPY